MLNREPEKLFESASLFKTKTLIQMLNICILEMFLSRPGMLIFQGLRLNYSTIITD